MGNDEKKTTPTVDASPMVKNGQPELPQMRILAQYIKDLSFENPQPGRLAASQDAKPQIKVGINVDAQETSKSEQFEVLLTVSVNAEIKEKTIFLCELAYAGIFALRHVPEKTLRAALLVECPRYLFPFSRRLIADLTGSSGFAPIMLDPIDFAALYRSKLQQQTSAGAASAAPQEK